MGKKRVAKSSLRLSPLPVGLLQNGDVSTRAQTGSASSRPIVGSGYGGPPPVTPPPSEKSRKMKKRKIEQVACYGVHE